MEKITLINGNNKKYTQELPKIVIQSDNINDVALNHILKQTGIRFAYDNFNNYVGQPKTCKQLSKLFLTYNFKTRYFDNIDFKNTLFLKFNEAIK